MFLNLRKNHEQKTKDVLINVVGGYRLRSKSNTACVYVQHCDKSSSKIAIFIYRGGSKNAFFVFHAVFIQPAKKKVQQFNCQN